MGTTTYLKLNELKNTDLLCNCFKGNFAFVVQNALEADWKILSWPISLKHPVERAAAFPQATLCMLTENHDPRLLYFQGKEEAHCCMLLYYYYEYYVARSFQLAFLNNFAEPLLDFLFAS